MVGGAFDQTRRHPEFEAERKARGLFPYTKIGAEFDRQVKADVARFRELAKEAGLL